MFQNKPSNAYRLRIQDSQTRHSTTTLGTTSSYPIYKHPVAIGVKKDRLHFQLHTTGLDGFGSQIQTLPIATTTVGARAQTLPFDNSSTRKGPRISKGTLYTVHVVLYSSKKKSGNLSSGDLGDGAQKALHTIQGICILKKNKGINSFFRINSLSHNNESIIQTFPLYSPFISSLKPFDDSKKLRVTAVGRNQG